MPKPVFPNVFEADARIASMPSRRRHLSRFSTRTLGLPKVIDELWPRADARHRASSFNDVRKSEDDRAARGKSRRDDPRPQARGRRAARAELRLRIWWPAELQCTAPRSIVVQWARAGHCAATPASPCPPSASNCHDGARSHHDSSHARGQMNEHRSCQTRHQVDGLPSQRDDRQTGNDR